MLHCLYKENGYSPKFGGDSMTLEQAREILLLNQIPFEEQEFSSEAQYNHHNILYPHTKNTPPGSVIALVIPSQNSRKNLELPIYLCRKWVPLCRAVVWRIYL